MDMSKNANTSKPLLFISQPEWTTAESSMQTKYYIKLKEEEQEVTMIEDSQESSEQLEFIHEEMESSSEMDAIHAVKLKESVLPLDLLDETLESDEGTGGGKEQQFEIPVDRMAEVMKEQLAESGKHVKEHNEEHKSKKKADPQLVQMFLKNLMPKADDNLIKNIQEGNLNALEEELEPEENSKPQKPLVDDAKYLELKQKVSRLARYPSVLKRPFCEAYLNGRKMKFQIESKRGDLVRLRIGKKVQEYKIDDLVDFKVL